MSMTDPTMSDANSLDRVMEIAEAKTKLHGVIHAVEDNADAIFRQICGEVDLCEVLDLQAELQPNTILEDDPTSPVCKWGDKEWREFGYQSTKWRLSQFVHGE